MGCVTGGSAKPRPMRSALPRDGLARSVGLLPIAQCLPQFPHRVEREQGEAAHRQERCGEEQGDIPHDLGSGPARSGFALLGLVCVFRGCGVALRQNASWLPIRTKGRDQRAGHDAIAASGSCPWDSARREAHWVAPALPHFHNTSARHVRVMRECHSPAFPGRADPVGAACRAGSVEAQKPATPGPYRRFEGPPRPRNAHARPLVL